jgi:hypothetical protein
VEDFNIYVAIERKHFNDGKRHGWNSGIKIGNHCRKKKLWIPKNCLQCGETFYSYPSSNRRFCSQTCRSYFISAKKVRGWSQEYKLCCCGIKKAKWRNSCLERDDYVCQLCLKRSDNLVVHHLKAVVPFKEEAYNVDNGVTLCLSCHGSVHSDSELQSIGWYLEQ